ncbi:fimbrial protein [Pseudocitrobacter corydidari]|uniref:Fimbrial-like protein YadN n=1 Tax=Pseudocitrobacter corydidari TaxID=2891570 RepID=A0ABY3S5M1_9ENTR|nr:fimbrial protein [Pseudocitrobacter corydidari]UGS42032.1 putative fimbrial-like protein YadN [Pseudocitrobacter corydidari]
MAKQKLALGILFSLVSLPALALDGGQLDFAGLVSDNTCILHVNGGAQDGQISLATATTAEVEGAGVVNAVAVGAKAEPFSITVDCSAKTPAATAANLNMSSVFFSNSQGTLNNDMSVSQAASGVAIAVHYEPNASTFEQVKINDSTDIKNLTLTNGKATWNFRASYVKQAAAIPVVAGFVKTNAAYTITYP